MKIFAHHKNKTKQKKVSNIYLFCKNAKIKYQDKKREYLNLITLVYLQRP